MFIACAAMAAHADAAVRGSVCISSQDAGATQQSAMAIPMYETLYCGVTQQGAVSEGH